MPIESINLDASIMPSQARDMLGIDPARITRWRHHGKLLCRTKVGRHEMYKIADLLALEEKANADVRSGPRKVPA